MLNGAIDVAKNRDKYLDELKKVASDPAARKAFTDKLVNTAVEKGPAFVAKQLGIDPKYVDMAKTAYNVGQDIYQNRDAYMALAKDIATNPEVRKEFTQIFVGETLTRLGVTPEQQKLAQQFLKDPMGTLDANKEAHRPRRPEQGRHQQPADRRRQGVPRQPRGGHQGRRRCAGPEAKAGLAKLGITNETLATIESFAKDPVRHRQEAGRATTPSRSASELGIPPQGRQRPAGGRHQVGRELARTPSRHGQRALPAVHPGLSRARGTRDVPARRPRLAGSGVSAFGASGGMNG